MLCRWHVDRFLGEVTTSSCCAFRCAAVNFDVLPFVANESSKQATEKEKDYHVNYGVGNRGD